MPSLSLYILVCKVDVLKAPTLLREFNNTLKMHLKHCRPLVSICKYSLTALVYYQNILSHSVFSQQGDFLILNNILYLLPVTISLNVLVLPHCLLLR